MATYIFRHIAKKFSWIIALFALLASCTDERLGGGIRPETNDEGKVKVTFSFNIPGLMVPTRAGDGVDEQIETIDLFLFDEDDLLTEVVHLTKDNAEESFTENDNQYSGGEYTTPESGTTGTYSAWIDGNTSRIHFIANLKEGEFDFKEHEGGSETEVIAPLITRHRVYWGRVTFNGTTLSQNPVVLYRNYAKVTVGKVATGLTIDGWTLYHRPTYGTMAPCDRSKLSGSSSSEQEELNPFDFTLGTSDVSLPLADHCLMTEHNDANKAAAEAEITASSANVAYWCFEYNQPEFEGSSHVYAIFKITQTVDGVETSLYYKIALLYDAEVDDYSGVVTSRLPFTIKRNHEYTINFKGLSHQAGYKTFEEAVNHDPANNTEISIEESLPEIVSTNHSLRIEETAASGSTVRYYKDYTDPATTYTIDDILVYYDGDDCTTNGSSALMANSLKVTWQGEAPDEYVENSLSIAQATDADGEAIAHTYRVSFKMRGFADSESLAKHYTEGTLCIAEQHEKLLKRYVKVYMGPAITFRPLLISSDIPNLTDERLTILFTIPDKSHLPEDLYPIEIRFGSDRVDVEKNLHVDAMKVDFGSDAAQPYTDVLRWQDRDGDGKYSWTTHSSNKVTNSWGYKYIHTIATPPTTNEAQQRITLHTVVTNAADFKVMMEGRSTVTGSNIFNTRELDFMMQNDGTATFSTDAAVDATYGSWIAGTTGTTDKYQRIMLDDGLPESRYATRYINVMGFTSGTTVTIPYTLGTLVDGVITVDDETDNTTVPVLWVHYDKTKFKPTSVSSGTLGSEQTDINGNTFVSVTPASTGWAKGSITFSVLNEAKNSMIFFTARNKDKYGEYNATSFADGNVGYAYTGVNALPSTYRSAGALVSTVNKWDFNPAPSVTDGNYSFADKVSIPSGKDQDLYVRIDRPSAQSATITIDTKGAFELQAAPRSVTVTNSAGTTTTTYDYTIASSTTAGVYTVTLNSMESDYAYLHFKAASFNSACTIEFAGNDYNPGELTVTNAATPFLGFEYAQEDQLVNATPAYAKTTNVVPAIKGALIGVRVYLPKTLYTALNSGKDANTTGEEIFRFAFTSRNFKPVNASSTLTTTLDTQSNYNYYSVTQSTKNNTTHIITVKEGALHDAGKSITMDDGKSYEACYIDLLLESTAIESTENVKFLGANEAATDLSFYPYNTAIACSGSYQATVEHKLDVSSSSFTTDILSGVNTSTNITYQITLPEMGSLPRTNIPVKITHGGYLKNPMVDKTNYYKILDHSDPNYFIIGIDTENSPIKFNVALAKLPESGKIVNVTFETGIDVEKDNTTLANLGKTVLSMADLQAVTPTKVEMKSARNQNYVTIWENGASTNTTYLNMPRLTTNSQVYIKMTLGTAYAGQTFTLDIASVEEKGTPGLTPTNPSATVGDDGTIEFEMTTPKQGVAQIITINGKSSTHILPEIRQTIVSDEGDKTLYEIKWTGDGNTRGGTNSANFDNNGSQYYEQTIGSYTWCTKMDGSGLITFYAPRANMSLTIGAAKRAPTGDTKYNNPGGFLIYYNGDVTDVVNTDNYGKEALQTDADTPTEIVEQTFTLGEPGIYSIKRYSGDQFGIYYIKLQRQIAPFGDFKWYATKADGAAVSRGSGTWGAADALITATDSDSDGTQDVWVSDLAQELHLTVDGLNDGETTLTISGDYKFKDGTTSQTVTPESGAASLTLVPVNYYDSNNELVNGTFTLSGTSANFSYTETVDVNIRPWVLLTTNVEKYEPYWKQDGKGNYGIFIPYTKTYDLTFTVTDEQHTGKDISVCPKLTYNGRDNGGDAVLQLTSRPAGLESWDNGEVATINAVAYNTGYTFRWTAIAPGTPVHNINYLHGNTDIIVKNETGNFLSNTNQQIYYTYKDNSFNINRLRVLDRFLPANGSQGYVQYSTDNSNWNYLLGTGGETDYLHAEHAHYAATTATVPTFDAGSTFYVRISIPAAITADDAAYLKVKDGSGNDRSSAFGIPAIDTENGWATFTVTASSTAETWSNLYVYDSRIDDSDAVNRSYTEVGESARFHLKFEQTTAELKVELLQSDGSTVIADNTYSMYVGEYLYLKLTAGTAGTIPFKLNLQKGSNANNPSTVSSGQDGYLKLISTTKNGAAVDNLFTLSQLGSEVTISDAKVDDYYIICYEVLQSSWYRFKAEACENTTYTLKGSAGQTNGSTHSVNVQALPTDVYELYDADGTGSALMTVFRNGVSTDETVIVTNGFSDGAIAGGSHRNSNVYVNLFDPKTGTFSTDQTELVNGSKLGGSQTVTLNINYPTKMTIIYGNKVAGSSIKVGEDILPSPTNGNDVMTTTDYELQRGTYTISRTADEGRLWYLRLSPK